MSRRLRAARLAVPPEYRHLLRGLDLREREDRRVLHERVVAELYAVPLAVLRDRVLALGATAHIPLEDCRAAWRVIAEDLIERVLRDRQDARIMRAWNGRP